MDIMPEKQNIDLVFSNTTYYIDFYQRQYKWDEKPVKRLLEDIFYKFNEEFKINKDSDLPIKQLISKYSWYYLNTYVTNIIDGKIYIVDGQQRLTTLTLILVKLYHLSLKLDSKLTNWIKNKIVGQSGYELEFWMNHEEHNNTLSALLDGKKLEKINVKSGITAQNMVKNYQIIDKWLDKELNNIYKLESFAFYFLHRLVLVNLSVDIKEVPMVFEVINDRGVRLKPYEILKGKLLGQIEKDELVSLKFNEIWDKSVDKVNTFKEDEIDQFFVYYLKAKLADTKATAQKFDNDYHRIMFDDEFNSFLNLKHNSKKVKLFLQNQFKYYTELYIKILSLKNQFDESQPFVYFNSLTEMDTQFLLILSACVLNDEDEDEKIFIVSQQVDRLFCFLQLQRSYNSNEFATAVYKLSAEIRDKNVNEIKLAFDKYLLDLLADARGVKVNVPLSYGFFKETGIELDKRFKRYFFARIEKFLADSMNLQMKHSMYDLVQNTGAKNGFHIEHILSENKENKRLFKNDDELFERERNRMGGLLILKGKDNQSSNNETYKDKLKSYANTLYWNETLREDSYKSKLDFKKMINKFKLEFRPMNKFGQAELEERHKLLFEMIKIIWNEN
ncbi:MAG: DUF262 domain-containing protein [Candidatus Delongbacteria bacterium]|jgi:uncharacterized protein with ParB-like and HNH nuclease domain|nr:DUF262 domain-containing protein [Candidatus Delongbacteria bacterium]